MIPFGIKQEIKLHRGLRTQGNSNNNLLLRMDFWEVGNTWYQQWWGKRGGGGLYPWSVTLLHILEGKCWRLCSADSGTSDWSGLGTEGYFWMTILLSLGEWWIPWVTKKITSPDRTLGNPGLGNDDLDSIWKLLFAFVLEYNGMTVADGSIWSPNVRKFKDRRKRC